MFKGHPKGLYVLFFTEMWERFSFYSMLALFALYMSAPESEGGLGWHEDHASHVYGLYIGLVYFTPFFGGLIADHLTGYRRAILIGGVFFCIGHLLLAVEHMVAFYSALGFLIIGNGLFKPNISTMVGRLYPPGSPKRDSAFNIFYMGINTGALIAPLVASYLAKHLGWHYGFGAAAVGMFVSVIVFSLTSKHLAHADRHSGEVEQAASEEDVPRDVQRRRVIALFVIYGIVILFWMAFHQNGVTLNYWARDNTWWFSASETVAEQPHPSITQAFNPAFVILFTFLVVPFWAMLRRRGKEPSTPGKVGIGMLLTAAAFGIMGLAGLVGGDAGRVWVGWLIGGYAVVTLGELCLSPMGLSLVTKLAPRRHSGLMMGLWFVATALGNYLSGLLGTFWKSWLHSNFFFFLVGSSLFAAAILLVFLPFLKRAMPEEKAPS